MKSQNETGFALAVILAVVNALHYFRQIHENISFKCKIPFTNSFHFRRCTVVITSIFKDLAFPFIVLACIKILFKKRNPFLRYITLNIILLHSFWCFVLCMLYISHDFYSFLFCFHSNNILQSH